MPIFFTFLIVAVVIHNLLEILSYFTSQSFWTSLKKFKVIGSLCVLTQIVNPVMARFEPATPTSQLQEGKYEDNWLYYTRNVLTSIAICTLSFYNVNTCLVLCKYLRTHASFANVKRRVIYLSVLIEIVMILRLAMIWLANYFWYMPS